LHHAASAGHHAASAGAERDHPVAPQSAPQYVNTASGGSLGIIAPLARSDQAGNAQYPRDGHGVSGLLLLIPRERRYSGLGRTHASCHDRTYYGVARSLSIVRPAAADWRPKNDWLTALTLAIRAMGLLCTGLLVACVSGIARFAR
jgi:hypothetical protein